MRDFCTVQVVASADDIESLCMVLNGNLKEHYTSAEGEGSGQVHEG